MRKEEFGKLLIVIAAIVGLFIAFVSPLAYSIRYFTTTPELPTGSSDCIFISLMSSWVIAMILTLIFYMKGRWRRKLDDLVFPEMPDMEVSETE